MTRGSFLVLVVVAGVLVAAAPSGAFRDVTRSSGVSMKVATDLPRLKLIATMSGGCALGDYDGDGRPDLYVTNSIAHWGKAIVASVLKTTAPLRMSVAGMF